MSKKKILDFKKLNFKNFYIFFLLLSFIMFLLIWFFPLGKFNNLESTLGSKFFLTKRILELTEKKSTYIFLNVMKEVFRKDSIVYFILILGGTLNIIKKSKVFQKSFETVSEFLADKEILFLVVFTTIFSIECIKLNTNVFLGVFPILLIISYLLGHSITTGISVIILGGGLKLICEYFVHFVPNKSNNLYQFADLEYFIKSLVLFFLTISAFLILYIKKFQKKIDLKKDIENINNYILNKKSIYIKSRKKNMLIIFLILALFVFSIYGMIFFSWRLDKVGALFIWTSILIGLICKMRFCRINILFFKGSKKLFNYALALIFFKIIISIFSENKFFYNLKIYLKDILFLLPEKLYSLGIYILDFIINVFLTPSSSEKFISTPIMMSSTELIEMNFEVFTLYKLGEFILPLSLITILTSFLVNMTCKKWIQFLKKIFLIGTALGSAVILFIFFTVYREF